MRGFEFRLEALLTHRKQIEKEKQRRVGVIEQEIQTILTSIRETQFRIAAENRTLGTKELVGKLDMSYIAHEKKYVGNLHVRIALAMEKVRELEKAMHLARTELLEAARSRKVIDKLREKQLARWRAELERKETAQLDEVGSQLMFRNAG